MHAVAPEHMVMWQVEQSGDLKHFFAQVFPLAVGPLSGSDADSLPLGLRIDGFDFAVLSCINTDFSTNFAPTTKTWYRTC